VNSGVPDTNLATNGMCFACGERNPIGLHLSFSLSGNECTSEFHIQDNYQGFSGIAHGGLLATALDEVMARLLYDKGYRAITARLEVRYRLPAEVGQTLQLRARLLKIKGRLFETEAQATLKDGTLIAEAKATSMSV
jgi:acyl-coenzyme A thioesterase PaaI-like protein